MPDLPANPAHQPSLFAEDFLASIPELFLEGVDELDWDLDMPGNVQYGFVLPEDRISKPVKLADIPAHAVKPKNAAALVERGIVPPPDCMISVVVRGHFEFSDMLEAIVRRYGCSEMMLSSLSIGERCIDSLRALMDDGKLNTVSILLSDYFYAMHRNTVYRYLYERLPIEKTTVAVSGIHTKVWLLRLADGTPLTIQGSANLRSSWNVEQFAAVNSESEYQFHRDWLTELVEKFKTKGRKGVYYGERRTGLQGIPRQQGHAAQGQQGPAEIRGED